MLTKTVGTEVTTVYDTALTYNVTAGVGHFNGSLVRLYLDYIHSLDTGYQYRVLPYNNFAVVYNLVTNPTYATSSAPVQCKQTLDRSCFSYLLSGGAVMATPWDSQSHLDYPMIRLEKVPAIQVEFQKVFEKSFTEKDCDLFEGPGNQAIAFCVAQVHLGMGTWRAGIYP